jgi:hypothetical protein
MTKDNPADSSLQGHEPALTAEDRAIALILEAADRDCEAGLGLSGDEARQFLEELLQRARTRGTG